MELSLDKSATLTITKDKVTQTDYMNLPNNNLKGLNFEQSYKYLYRCTQVKKKTSWEYN